MSTVSRFGSFSRDLRYGQICDAQMRFALKIQRYDVGTTATYTNRILGFSSSPYHFVQSIGALPGGIGRSGMVCSKELDLCYNFHLCGFFDFGDPAIRKSSIRERPSHDSHSSWLNSSSGQNRSAKVVCSREVSQLFQIDPTLLSNTYGICLCPTVCATHGCRVSWLYPLARQ